MSPLNFLKWTQLSLTLLDESKLVSVSVAEKLQLTIEKISLD